MKSDELDVWLPMAEVVALTGENKSTATRKIAAGKYQGRRVSSDGRAPGGPPFQSPRGHPTSLRKQACARLERRGAFRARRRGSAGRCRRRAAVRGGLSAGLGALRTPVGNDQVWHASRWMSSALSSTFEKGMRVKLIDAALQSQYGTSPATVWRYRKAVEGHPRPHWRRCSRLSMSVAARRRRSRMKPTHGFSPASSRPQNRTPRASGMRASWRSSRAGASRRTRRSCVGSATSRRG